MVETLDVDSQEMGSSLRDMERQLGDIIKSFPNKIEIAG